MTTNAGLPVGVALGAALVASAAAAGTLFERPLSADDLDAGAFTQWVDGAESALPCRDGPRHVMWTVNSRPEWDGVRFGDGKKTEARHLRIGWKRPVGVGTVLARGGGRLSVLKATAAYPGDVTDEAQWVAAERIVGRSVATEAARGEDIVMWVLPPGFATRAIRFTHVPQATDKSYAGWLGAACVLTSRLANVAPQAAAATRRNPDAAHKINNGSNDGTWGAWDNGGDKPQVSRC